MVQALLTRELAVNANVHDGVTAFAAHGARMRLGSLQEQRGMVCALCACTRPAGEALAIERKDDVPCSQAPYAAGCRPVDTKS